MKLAKRLFPLFFLLTLGLGFNAHASEDTADNLPPVTLIKSNDLQADGELAHQRQLPILLMFSQRGCPWCRFVEEDHLKPMLRNANYRAQVIIRQVMTDDYSKITDFDGNKITAAQLASRYNAALTPTVIFVDHNGKALAPRILGVRNTEYYGLDLDEGLAMSLQKMRQLLAALKLR